MVREDSTPGSRPLKVLCAKFDTRWEEATFRVANCKVLYGFCLYVPRAISSIEL